MSLSDSDLPPSFHLASNLPSNTRDEGIVVIGLAVLLFGRMWIWGPWIRKAIKYCTWGLMGYPDSSMVNSGAEGGLNCEVPA